MTQAFKGDAVEQQFQNAGRSPFDACTVSKDDFFQDGYTSADFLLMLYDAGRMPFSARVPRDAFVRFIRQAIPNFNFTGTFESYLFILNSIFGEAVEVLFNLVKAASEKKDLEGKPAILSPSAQAAKEKLKELDPEKAKEIPEPELDIPGGLG